MEKPKVSFKVHFKHSKATKGLEDETRRFELANNDSSTYAYLNKKLISIFPQLKNVVRFNLSWIDEDGDLITVKNEDDLQIALRCMAGEVKKFTVLVQEDLETQDAETAADAASGKVHAGVHCDGCEGQVAGFRYKCVVCPDYDLCSSCEHRGIHPGHNMIRISSPKVWPHHFFSQHGRIHDKIQKKARGDALKHAQKSWESIPGNSFMPCGFRCGHFIGSPMAIHCNPAFKDHCTLLRQLVDAMVKGRACAKVKCCTSAADKAEVKSEDKANLPFDDLLKSAFSSSTGTEFLKNLGSIVSLILDPLGVDVQVNIHPPSEDDSSPSATKTQENETAQRPAASEDRANHEVPSKGYPKEADTKDSKNDEDWTVVQKAPSHPSCPEVSKEASASATNALSAGTTTCAAAAQAMEPGQAASSGPPILTTAQPKRSDDEALRLPQDPRIQVAVQAMMNMGFTNDGGWLTQLLESKHGDIGKVLDALQPAALLQPRA